MPDIIQIIKKILKKLIFLSIIIIILYIIFRSYLSYLDKENIEIKPFGLGFGENDVIFVLEGASNKKISTEKCSISDQGIILGCEQRSNAYIEKLVIYNNLPNDNICKVTFGNKLFSPSAIYRINPPFPLSYKSIIYKAKVHPILGITAISANLVDSNKMTINDIRDSLYKKYITKYAKIFMSYRNRWNSDLYMRRDTEDRTIDIEFKFTNKNRVNTGAYILYEWNTLSIWNEDGKKQELMEECLDKISTIRYERMDKNRSKEIEKENKIRREKENKRIRDQKLNNDAL